MYSMITIVFCLVAIRFGECEKSVLLQLKSDINKVGKDFENLMFDIVRKIVVDVNLNEDYYSSIEDSSIQKPVTQHTVTKKFLSNSLENTTEVSTTETTLNETIEKKNLTEDKVISQNRLKRSINKNSSIPIVIDKSINDSPILNNTPSCNTKSQETHVLELKNLEDLKEEIKKLHDLVVLLRDQQRILSILDQDTNNLDSGITSRFGTKELIKMLSYINTRDMQEKQNDVKAREENTAKISTLNELVDIKKELRGAVETLNKTREALVKERKKGLLLEKELSDQRLDLNFLKMMVRKLYKTDTSFHIENIDDDILGSVQSLPGDVQEHSQVVQNINRRVTESEDKLQLANSDLDDLERLLNKLKPKKTDFESKILELQREIEKKKQEEDMLKQLRVIERRLGHETDPQKSKISPDPETQMLKTLESMLDGGTKIRSLDGNVEVELQKLQDAIDSLRINNELDMRNDISQNQEEDDAKQFQALFKKLFDRQDRKEDDENVRFQKMLDKMFNPESKREDDSAKQFQIMLDNMAHRGNNNSNKISPEMKMYGLLIKEVMELRKRLASMEKSSGGEFYSPDGSYIPLEISEVYEKPPGSLNYPPYVPYLNPGHRNMNSQIYKWEMNSIPNNQHYTDYIPPPNYMPTKFTYPNGNWYNFEGNKEKNIHQIHYGQPNKPEQFNVHPLFDENSYQNKLIEPHVIPNTFEANTYRKTTVNDDPNFFRNKFFLEPHQQPEFTKPFPNTVYYSENPSRNVAKEPTVNPPKTAEDVTNIYEKIEDLKTQIYSLQNIIDELNNPYYTQTPQDREMITTLEEQITDLKGAIDNIDPGTVPPSYAPHPSNSDQNMLPPDEQQNYPHKSRRRRSVQHEEAESDSKLFDKVAPGLKQMIFTQDKGRKTSYEDVKKRIDNLRYQLEARNRPMAGQSGRSSPIVSYQPPYYQLNHLSPPKPNDFSAFESEKNDIFTSVVLKILDKVIGATPAVLERLFGFGLGELINFRDSPSEGGSYGYKVDYGVKTDLQKLFKSLGYFGYGPLILLKLIDGFTTFVKILKKNEFFKNFLMPALVLLIVAGAVVFLIWWLQPSEGNNDLNYSSYPRGYYGANNDKYGRTYSKYNYRGNGYDHNYNGYGYGGGYVSYYR